MTASLREFLLARIAEDEALASACQRGRWTYDSGAAEAERKSQEWFGGRCQVVQHESVVGPVPTIRASVNGSYFTRDMKHIANWDPARVLAECKAKRTIVEGMEPWGTFDDLYAPEILGLLASPYASHPDYRQEWAA